MVLDPPALAPVLDCCMEGIVIACPPVPPLYLAPEAGEPSGQGFIGTCGAPSYLASEAGEPSDQGCIDAVGPPHLFPPRAGEPREHSAVGQIGFSPSLESDSLHPGVVANCPKALVRVGGPDLDVPNFKKGGDSNRDSITIRNDCGPHVTI